MANIVSFTVRGTDETTDLWAKVKAQAAAAGIEAADAFNTGFKLRASTSASSTGSVLAGTESLAGDDKELLNKLKGYASTPGGIGILGTGNDTSLLSMLRQQLLTSSQNGGLRLLSSGGSGATSTDDLVKQVLTNSVTGNTSSEEFVRQVLENNVTQDTSSTDMVKQVLQNNVTGNVTTEDFIKQVLQGEGPKDTSTTDTIKDITTGDKPRNTDTTDTIHEKLDLNDADIVKKAEADADRYINAFSQHLKNHTSDVFGNLFGGAADDVARDAENLGDDVAEDIGNGIKGGGGGSSGGILTSLSEALSAAGEYAIPAAIGIGALLAPFIAQAISGALVAGFGAGIAGIAIVGALQSPKVQAVFTSLKNNAVNDLGDIGQSFQPVMESIFNTAANVLNKLTPVFSNAAQLISGPFQGFSDTLIKAFGSSSVQQSISAVAKAFGDILKAVTPQLAGDVGQVASAITNIASAVAKNPQAVADFAKGLTDIVSGTLNLIAKLTDVGNYLDKSWPAFWSNAGGTVKGTWNIITSTISSAVDTVVAILKAFAALFTGNWTALGNALDSAWHAIWNGIKGSFGPLLDGIVDVAKAVWPKLQSTMADVMNNIESLVHQGWSIVANYFSSMWNQCVSLTKSGWASISGAVSSGWNTVARFIEGVPGDLRNWFTTGWNSAVSVTRTGWSDLYNAVVGGWNTTSHFISGIPGDIRNTFSGAVGWLSSAGRDIISGLYNGIKSGLGSVASWVSSNITSPIIDAVKSFFGIHSPSTVMAEIGGHLINGMIKGLITSASGIGTTINKVFGSMPESLLHLLEKGFVGAAGLPGKALSALKGLGSSAVGVLKSLGGDVSSIWDDLFGSPASSYNPGAGVSQWKSVVDQALKLVGLPTSLDNQVLYQMQTESGGNPNAINLTDSNALLGDPSKGLLQVIGTTFSEYHVPGTSGNIYDPLANVAAAINYAKAAYGPTLMSGSMGLGSGHGYAAGGATSAGWAVLGEQGRELVKLPGGSTVYPHANTQQMLSGGGCTHQVVISFDASKAGADKTFISALAGYMRNNGGAQKVLPQ